MIGLVGHSGSGKSTLVNLICRFYDVTDGAIRSTASTCASAWPNTGATSALVLQEPFLFFGTIAENIAYGKPGATREEIVAAARAAHAHEFILRLPHGYDSMVGERGQGLSGGERQRLSSPARAADRPAHPGSSTKPPPRSTPRPRRRSRRRSTTRCRAAPPSPSRTACRRCARRPPGGDGPRPVVEVGTHDELLARQGAYRLYLRGAGATGRRGNAAPAASCPRRWHARRRCAQT